MTTFLTDLCTKMVADGYDYAHFNAKTDYESYKHEPTIDRKPVTALFFSRLVEYWDSHDENNKQYVPDWYNKLTMEDWEVDKYGKRNITFAKIASYQHIIKQVEDKDLLNRYRRDLTFGDFKYPRFDWPGIQVRGFKGVLVAEPECDMHPFGTWDVQTLAIWDVSALVAVKHFANAGKPYHYVVDNV
jgi:hypothetical protein